MNILTQKMMYNLVFQYHIQKLMEIVEILHNLFLLHKSKSKINRLVKKFNKKLFKVKKLKMSLNQTQGKHRFPLI